MSVATVVNRGYGTASYADVHRLPMIGYGLGAAIVVGAPLLFHAGEIYRPGSMKGGAYNPGAKAGEIYRPGAMAGETG